METATREGKSKICTRLHSGGYGLSPVRMGAVIFECSSLRIFTLIPVTEAHQTPTMKKSTQIQMNRLVAPKLTKEVPSTTGSLWFAIYAEICASLHKSWTLKTYEGKR
jgi:hypothetical protein